MGVKMQYSDVLISDIFSPLIIFKAITSTKKSKLNLIGFGLISNMRSALKY